MSFKSEWRSREHAVDHLYFYRIKQRANWHSGKIHTGLLSWHTWMTEPLPLVSHDLNEFHSSLYYTSLNEKNLQ